MNPNTGGVPHGSAGRTDDPHMSTRTRRPRTPFDLAHFQYRIVRDAMNEATASYWLRRARDFATALPREGDYLGQSTPEQREARTQRLLQIVKNCVHRSTICELTPEEERLILDELANIYRRSAAIRASDLQEGRSAA